MTYSDHSYVAMALLALAMPAVLWGQGRGGPVPEWKDNSITAPRPLAEIADVLQIRYHKAVTYEDPNWTWPGNVEPISGIPSLRWRRASLPVDLIPERVPSLDVGALANILKSYERENDTPLFRVFESNFAIHIAPSSERDSNGEIVPANSALDTVITVPTATRSASDHFIAICKAIIPAFGRKVMCVALGWGEDWYERLFAAPGGTLEWGAKDVKARDALIDLLSRSATTFTWRLFCQPASFPGTAGCAINLLPLQISAEKAAPGKPARYLQFDRCPSCVSPQK